MTKSKRLRHLLFGRFELNDKIARRAAINQKTQQRLAAKIVELGSLAGYKKTSPSYAQTKEQKQRRIPPELILFIEEHPPTDGQYLIESEIKGVAPDDEFGITCIQTVIEPAAEQIFGKKIKFTIQSK